MYLHSPESLKNEMAVAGYNVDTAIIDWAAGEAVKALAAANATNRISDSERMMEFFVRA